MSAAFILLILLLHLAVFVGVGRLLRDFARVFDGHPEGDDALLIWGGSALAGYLTFWVYLIDLRAGVVFSIVLTSAGLVRAAIATAAFLRRADDRRAAMPVIALVLGVALVYLGVSFVLPMPGTAFQVVQERFFPGAPADNLLPSIFADRLWGGTDPRGFPNTWLSSDRPPLQAGILLVQRPLTMILGDAPACDQVLGTIAQLGWITAVWSLCALFGLDGRRRGFVLLFCIASGFFLFNSVFVWPKLLAAGCGVGAIAQFLRARFEGRTLVRSEWLVSAILAALALLAHSGVAFTFIGVALLFPLFRKQFEFRGFAIAILSGLTLMLPWFWYQTVYEPPGNRLTKMHLAGSPGIDDRSFLEALKDGYGRLDGAQIVEYKLRNATVLVGSVTMRPDSDGRRDDEFRYLLRAFGFLNLGWVSLVFMRRRVARGVGTTVAIALVSVLGWVILMYGSGTTIVHSGSYATVILLFVTLAVAILMLPDKLATAVLMLHAAMFGFVWLSPVVAGGTGFDETGVSVEFAVMIVAGLVVSSVALVRGARPTLSG